MPVRIVNRCLGFVHLATACVVLAYRPGGGLPVADWFIGYCADRSLCPVAVGWALLTVRCCSLGCSLSGGRSCRYLDGKAGWAFFGGGVCRFRDPGGSRNGLDQKQKLHGAAVHRDFPSEKVGKRTKHLLKDVISYVAIAWWQETGL